MDEHELFDMEIQDPIDIGGTGCSLSLGKIILIGLSILLLIGYLSGK